MTTETNSIPTTPLYADPVDSRHEIPRPHNLVPRSLPAGDRFGPEQPAHTARPSTADKQQIVLRPRQETTHDQMFPRSRGKVVRLVPAIAHT